MAVVTNAVETYDLNTNREDLSEAIYNSDPFDTPFIGLAGETTATNVKHEWSQDTLDSVDTTNAQVEGEADTRNTSAVPTRHENYTQISKRNATVTGSQMSSNAAGIDNDMDYQMIKKGRELRRDMEAILTQNQGFATGSSGTARKLRSLESWLKTNADRGSGGADATTETTAAKDATTANLRTFTEAILKDVLKLTFDSGGNPTTIMVGSFNKQKFSGFSGRSASQFNMEENQIVAAADAYVSDFGTLNVIPNRRQRGRTAFVLDPEHVAVSYLDGRKLFAYDLAKVGDADTQVIGSEYTLEMRNEKAHGVAADLTTS